jgi:hypothetical protein
MVEDEIPMGETDEGKRKEEKQKIIERIARSLRYEDARHHISLSPEQAMGKGRDAIPQLLLQKYLPDHIKIRELRSHTRQARLI